MDYYSYTKILPKPVTVAIMIPLVMMFLFIVVPLVLVFATILFVINYFKKKKYRNNRHYQEFERTVLPTLKAIFGKRNSSQKPSDAVVDVKFKEIDKDKLSK